MTDLNLDLKQKTALVTGATSGIGLAIAKALAEQGMNVVINGLGDQQQIDAALAEITAQASGGEISYADFDLQDPAACRGLVQHCQRAHGQLEVLVNNAGVQHVDRVEHFPEEKWEQVIAINLSAVFHTSAAALPAMQANNFGRIINIASVHGQVASANKAAYIAAKHGVLGLTKVIALENAQANITCNAICPGWVLTPLVEAQIQARAEQEGVDIATAQAALLGEKQPSLRFTRVEDIANAALYLLSPASDNTTGSSMTLDGGWTAQ